MSQWGRMNVRLQRVSSNARICVVLGKAGGTIVADGYKMIRLIIEHTDADSAEPDEIL